MPARNRWSITNLFRNRKPRPAARRPVRVKTRFLRVEWLEPRRLLTDDYASLVAPLLAVMTPDPHPSGDLPANLSQVVPLAVYTAAAAPPDSDNPYIEPYVLGVEAIFSAIAANSAARPAVWGANVPAAPHEFRLHLDDNGMLIQDWTIDWGDGSDPQTVSPQPWVIHQYPAAGQYTISVTADSPDGTFSASSTSWVDTVGIGGSGGGGGGLQVTLGDSPPTLHVAGPQTVAQGQTFALDGLADFSDPNTDDTATSFTYSIDWGDGSPMFNGSNVDVIALAGVASADAPFLGALASDTADGPLTHVYAAAGNYDLAVTVVSDTSGLSDTQTIPIDVVQLAPTISSTYTSGNEGTPDTFTASVSTALTDPVAYQWQVLDSSGDLLANGTDPTLNYTFTAPDTYTVLLTATVDNVTSTPAVQTVTVDNVAPIFVGSIPSVTLGVGQTYSIPDVAFTDVNPNDTHTATVDWGDGSSLDTGATVTEETSDGTSTTPGSITDSYAYSAVGTYTATVYLTDSEGLSPTPETFAVDVVNGAVALTDFSTDGTNLDVTYNVTTATAAPFGIDIYASSDGTTPDQLLMSYTVDGTDSPLTTGSHTASFVPAFDDVPGDYHLIAVSDASSDPTQNTVEFDGGIFAAASVTASPQQDIVYVFGNSTTQTVDIYGPTDSPTSNAVVINGGTPFTIGGSITGIDLRGEDGAFTVLGDKAVTLPLSMYGGSGNDTFAGGEGNDVIVGGTGTNVIHSSDGVDSPQIVDDSDLATGGEPVNYFHDTGSWTPETVAGAFNGGEQASSGSATAVWTFDDLDPSAYYDLYVTWEPIAGASAAAQYSVYDDGTLLAGTGTLATVNQTQAPADLQAAGEYWQSLGVYQATSQTLIVHLVDGGGTVLADAAMIVPAATPPLTNLVMDNFGIDDNGNLSVTYTINGEDAPPFSIGIYGSPDGIQPTTLLQTNEVDDPSLLAGGDSIYTVSFPASLDGIDSSEYILAQLDSSDAVEETSKADNISTPLSGIFEQADGTLVMLGNASSLTGDNIGLTQDLLTGNVTADTANADGDPLTSNTFSGVTSVVVSTPAGNNAVNVDPSVTVPVSVFAGPDSSLAGKVAATDATPSIALVNVEATIDKGSIATLSADVGNLGGLGFSVTVDWGLYEGTDTIAYPAGTISFSMTHQYVDDGSEAFAVNFPITISVTASNGRIAYAYTNAVGVDVAPTVNITGEPSWINPGTPITVSAIVADPGEFGAFTYYWAETGGGDSSSGTSASFNFTPTNDDDHTVSLTVTDPDGETVPTSVVIPGMSGGSFTPLVADVPTVTIQECDADGTLDPSAVVAGADAYFLVSVGGAMPNDGTVTVYYNTANGPSIDGSQVAVADTDYTASGDKCLTFCSASGYNSKIITVDTNPNSNGGTFSVDVSGYVDPFATTPDTPTSATAKISPILTIDMLTEASRNQIPVTNNTNAPQSVIVGQWIELAGSYGSLANVQSEGWSDPNWNANPPAAVAGYTENPGGGTATLLQGGLISTGVLENLYWTKPGKYTVTYTVKYIDGAGKPQSATATTTFDVAAPPINFTAQTTTLNQGVDVRPVNGLDALQFGNDKRGTDGMDWTVHGMKVAPVYTGNVHLVQLVVPTSFTNAPLLVASTYSEYILDNPLQVANDKVAVQGLFGKVNPAHSADRPPNWLYDSPYLPLQAGSNAYVHDQFQTYLQYMPTGPRGTWTKSIYVTLQEMDWQWSGSATKGFLGWNRAGNGQFTQNPVANPESLLPQWTSDASAFNAQFKNGGAPATLITGTVAPNGNPVNGATVTAVWPDPNIPGKQDRLVSVTDALGQYSIPAVFGTANVTLTEQVGNGPTTTKTSNATNRSQNMPVNFP